MKHKGFTLLELILVSGIAILLCTLVVPAYRNCLIRNDLSIATGQVTQALARTRLLSESGKYDTGWGFNVSSGTLYKGNSYDLRDPNFDEHYFVPTTIEVSGIQDIFYEKLTGIPSQTGQIILTTRTNEQRRVIIDMDRYTIAVSSPSYP